MREYIVIVEVQGNREHWKATLSENREVAKNEAIELVKREKKERGLSQCEFINIIVA